MNFTHIQKEDPQLYSSMQKEEERQLTGLELIPSENYVSPAVLEAMGSILTNKYSEGYPGKRYYAGNDNIDEIEVLTQKRAISLFRVEHANVQPYSGSPANLAVYLATCKPGDTIMGLNLTDGGHLTHGWKVSATGIFYNSIPYHVTDNGRVDFDEVERLVKEHKPKLLWAGATAYVYQYEFEKFAKIAEKYGAYFAADIAHTAGLVVGGVHTDPVPFAHIVTTTTHKTLRGPRGAMIMVTKKGLEKDPELSKKIDNAVFPGLQGGPHDHTTAAIAVALKEASSEGFKKYAVQIVKNAKVLAGELVKEGFSLIGNGTENHLILADLTSIFGPGGGYFVQYALEKSGLTLNKNTIPKDQSSPFYPSGIRLGTPALTTRGLREDDMVVVAKFIKTVIDQVQLFRLPTSKEERISYLERFREKVGRNQKLKKVREEVKEFVSAFPIFQW